MVFFFIFIFIFMIRLEEDDNACPCTSTRTYVSGVESSVDIALRYSYLLLTTYYLLRRRLE